MIFTETKLKGAFVVEIKKLNDERGFFGRTFCKKEMEEHGLHMNIVQANTSFNKIKGTLRGMHFQVHPHEEIKLVQCIRGAIFDVIVDLRSESPTYLQWFGIELSEENYKMMYIPKRFAHGFITLRDNSEISYQMSAYYDAEKASGIRWDDPSVDIKWPIEPSLISERDKNYPDLVVKKKFIHHGNYHS